MVKQSYCTGETGVSVVSRPSDGLYTISFIIWNFLKLISLYSSFSLFAQEHDGLCSVWRRTWKRWRGRAAQVPPGSKWRWKKNKTKYSRQNSDLNKPPEITWRCSRSQWWNDAPSSDASRQDGKREEEEKEEQEEQEAPLWQQWFGEWREEEGETKEGSVAFKSGLVSRAADHLRLWSNSDLSSVSQALDAEDKRIKQMEAIMQVDERKRPYNSLLEVKAPTEEEMEAFRMKRCRADDPMASFLGQWDLWSSFSLTVPRYPFKDLTRDLARWINVRLLESVWLVRWSRSRSL